MFFDHRRLLHVMDTKTRCSAGTICDHMTLDTSAQELLACWIKQIWTPHMIRGDHVFNHESFIDFVKTIASTFEPIPPRHHQRNVPQSKRGVIHSIYLRLKEAESEVKTGILAVKTIDIPNQLYGEMLCLHMSLAMVSQNRFSIFP